MLNWIKKLSKGSKPDQAVDPQRQTRVVKRILPASLRQAHEEAEAAEAAAEAEKAATATKAAARKASEEARSAPTITLSPNFPKPTASVPEPEEAAFAPEAEPIHMARPAVRLTQAPAAPEETQEKEPAPDAAPPMVRLTSARKKPAISFNAAPGGATAAPTTREIVLNVSDFLSRIPSHFVDEKAVSATQEVRFDAADLYSDMSKGRATVPLSIIAEAIPALFKKRLSPEEDIEIQLPLPKIVAQMSDLLTRTDQEAPESFEELETPFLKAAQRDQALHKVSGAVAPPVAQTPPPQPPAAVEPAAEPAPAPRPKPMGLKLSSFTNPPDTVPTPAAAPKKRAIPDSGRRVTIRVRPLIQAMPIEQREALLGSISEDAQVDLPLDQIENQLSSGRVSLSMETFSEALDPSTRKLFKESYKGDNVPIALSEVIKNLPTQTFKMRDDQQVQEVNPDEFETPFNKKSGPAPAKPEVVPVKPVKPTSAPASAIPPLSSPNRAKPLITPSIANYTTRKLNSTGNKFPSPMHAALGTQDALDAKKVVKLASALPGVASLTIITGDGLGLAGNLPSFMDPEGFSAMAPQLHRKMAKQASDMKLGELKHLSLSTDTHTVTIFTGDGMTIAVLHQNQSDLGHGVKEKFIAIVDGLARQYSSELAPN